MNITEAATTITEQITDNLPEYNAADVLDDPRIVAAFAAVNDKLPTPLSAETLDILFADFAAVIDADSTLGGYLVRYTEAPAQEAELDACVRVYISNLNHHLRHAGYQGDDFTEDQFNTIQW